MRDWTHQNQAFRDGFAYALSQAAYDSVALKAWKSNIYFPELMELRPLPRRYKSNWRILHVDGFEAGKPIMFKTFQTISEDSAGSSSLV